MRLAMDRSDAVLRVNVMVREWIDAFEADEALQDTLSTRKWYTSTLITESLESRKDRELMVLTCRKLNLELPR